MNSLVNRFEIMIEEDDQLDDSCAIQSSVPIWRKTTLTIREAAEYSNIGINRLDRLLKEPSCGFVLWVGTKKLVKRKAFEEYLANVLEI